ncbi:MAG: DUF1499 domain-containing protein [Cellvibrionaceae bacterium]|nr:DUF1499 domain-containing protein [Cellvibrionaceae bacterium]
MTVVKPRRPWTFWLLAVQCLLLAIIPLFIIAYRVEAVSLKVGLWGPVALGMVITALGVWGLLVAIWASFSRRADLRKLSIAGALLGSLPLLVFMATVGFKGLSVPAIHDISTDTENPPLFVSALVERREYENSTDYDREKLPELQAKAYPHLRPVVMSRPKAEVFKEVKALVVERGWELSFEDPASAKLEATVTTSLFGFTDDVVIRLRSLPDGGTVLDMRSASRVGISDLGANAKRITDFIKALDN